MTPRRAAVLCTCLLGATVAIAGQDEAVVPLPPHTWVMTGVVDRPDVESTRGRLRDALLAAVRRSGLAPPGYPRPCRTVTTPDPERRDFFTVDCRESGSSSGDADGVLLTPEGHFLRLSVVDFPDSRAYLTEVYLVPHLPDPRLRSMARYDLPRIVIPFPRVPVAWHPVIWEVLERGLRDVGARALEPE